VNGNPFEREVRRIQNDWMREMLEDPRAEWPGTRQYLDKRCTLVIEISKAAGTDAGAIKRELALYWLGFPVAHGTFWRRLRWLLRALPWLLLGDGYRFNRRPW
jgi:hypothetical protein